MIIGDARSMTAMATATATALGRTGRGMQQVTGGKPTALRQREYQHLVERPRGFRMVVGVLARMVLATGLFAVFAMMGSSAIAQLGWSMGFSGHAGRYEATRCHDDISTIDKYEDTVCSGTLSTSDGHPVSNAAHV